MSFSDSYYTISTNVVDNDTGEVIYNKKYVNWSGWKNESYKFRSKAKPLKIYFDAGFDLKGPDLNVFIMICRIMNEDNLFMRKIDSSNKYAKKKYEPMTKDDIFEILRDRISKSTFERAWRNLNKKYIKKIRMDDTLVWAVNPAYAAKLTYLPLYLYVAFRDDLDPFLSQATRKKFHNLEMSTWK